MSTSVSLDASKTPTPPTIKMNGNISPRHHLNVSSISNSKHSGGTTSPIMVPPGGAGSVTPTANITLNSSTKPLLLDLSRGSLHPSLSSPSRLNRTPQTSKNSFTQGEDHGIYQMLASLALLCLLSLLMSFLALFFLQKIGPMTVMERRGTNKVVISADEYLPVYQVSVALSTLTIALDLCCLFVCCIQFLFAIKLLKTPNGDERACFCARSEEHVRLQVHALFSGTIRTSKFLKKSSHTRVLAIGGFFLSIPIFFTGVILFTFIHFQEVPAIATSIVIGIGIIFCGVASVQNVYLWQWEKTRASKDLAESRLSQLQESAAPDITAHAVELSTLV